MKITIELSDAEVRGIKRYLKDVGDFDTVTKENVADFVGDTVYLALRSPREAVNEYIKEEEA